MVPPLALRPLNRVSAVGSGAAVTSGVTASWNLAHVRVAGWVLHAPDTLQSRQNGMRDNCTHTFAPASVVARPASWPVRSASRYLSTLTSGCAPASSVPQSTVNESSAATSPS